MHPNTLVLLLSNVNINTPRGSIPDAFFVDIGELGVNEVQSEIQAAIRPVCRIGNDGMQAAIPNVLNNRGREYEG